MIQTMIIDDEYLIRERLKRLVEWEQLGFELAAEAEDGEEALELLEGAEVPVQLALVDINMPMIDGLEFARRAKESQPGLHIIFLTGYSDFDYVKMALRLGAANYILKPIDRDELAETLVKVRTAILEEEVSRAHSAAVAVEVNDAYESTRARFMMRLLDASASMEEQERKAGLKRYCPKLAEGTLVLAVAGADPLDEESVAADLFAGRHAERRHEQAELGLSLLAEAMQPLEGTEICYDTSGRLVMLSADEHQLEQACRKAVERIRDTAGLLMTLGVSGYCNFAEAGRGYQEAVLAMRHKAVYGIGKIIRYDELPTGWKPFQLGGLREQLLIDLRLGNPEDAEVRIRELFNRFKANPTHIDQLYYIVYELIAVLNVYAEEQQIEMTEDEAAALNAASAVDRLEMPERIEAWINGRMQSLYARSESQKRSASARLVETAKAYIDANYTDAELDLTAISQSLHINANYLSRIFKTECGLSITEYVTLRRMNKAKELLMAGYRNVEYIAEHTGYSDPHYFSKCFKKFYSVPPSKFSV
ncbi:response regulator [Paenibacillus sp. HJL G12]|uniref:Response regulator n=1 Tax=Paenibacillus dendrobii TaxID=2691084 RepID=A0A7X3LGN5_9BACL|nr:response regulator [Paenibacillus dendrobii]MWV44272.1 response regulator [Paenibacillus dendrobii]